MAQEATGEYAVKTLGDSHWFPLQQDKLPLCDLCMPEPWVSHPGDLVTKILSSRKKEKKKKRLFILLSNNKEHWNNAECLQVCTVVGDRYENKYNKTG